MKIDFCLPIKNEESIVADNIKQLISYLNSLNLDFPWQITGVINGSDDDSYQIFKRIADKYPAKVRCLSILEAGKGRAIKAAWKSSSADILIFMDIDLSVSLFSLPDLFLPLINNQADLVIGSRFLPASKTKRSWQRSLISRFYVFLSRFILSHEQSDLQCGFKAIRKDLFEKIEKYLRDDYWFLDTELLIFAHLLQARVKEIPVDWEEKRQKGRKGNIRIFKDSCGFIFNLIKLQRFLKKVKKDFK
jgi:glycosyltransferase involved in cell wall biosynthesis